MPVNLPTEVLRSFVAISDTGSMLQATERVFITQSAISLQMRRLEEIVRQPLFNRKGHKLRLTLAGEHLLVTARQILGLNDRVLASLQGQALLGAVRMGFNYGFTEGFLPSVLNEFIATHPEIQMQVRTGESQELLLALKSEQLDVVLCVRPKGDTNNIKTVQMKWIGQPHLLEQDTLPLALLEEPCLFRSTALGLLEEAGSPFRIVVEAASLAGVKAAVQAGLAITCRTPFSIESESMPALKNNYLPSLPEIGYALFTSKQLSPAATRLAEFVRKTVLEKQ
jgi:DNA-binding transcriptional LysR family regulator